MYWGVNLAHAADFSSAGFFAEWLLRILVILKIKYRLCDCDLWVWFLNKFDHFTHCIEAYKNYHKYAYKCTQYWLLGLSTSVVKSNRLSVAIESFEHFCKICRDVEKSPCCHQFHDEAVIQYMAEHFKDLRNLSYMYNYNVKLHIPRESYHMSSQALDIKLGLDISQKC